MNYTEVLPASDLTGTEADVDGAGKDARHSPNGLTEMQARYLGILDTLLVTSLGDIGSALDYALARMGALSDADRVYLCPVSQPRGRLEKVHEWCAEGVAPGIDRIEDLWQQISEDPNLLEQLRSGNHLHVRDVSALPAGRRLRKILAARDVHSFLAVPIQQDGHLTGFIGYEFLRQARPFRPGELNLVRSIAGLIYWVQSRHDSETRLRDAHVRAQRSQHHLQSVLDAIPDLVLEVDDAGEPVAWHSDRRRIPDMLSGLDHDNPTAPDGAQGDLRRAVGDAVRQMAAEGRVAGQTVRLGQGVTQRRYEISGSPIDGRTYALVLREVDRAHGMPDSNLLSDIVRSTTNLVLVADPDRRIEWANPALEKLTGWTLEEIRGRRPQDFMRSANTDPASADLIDEKLAKGEGVRVEIANMTRDGRELWLALSIQPLLKPDGDLRGFLAVGSDITDLRAQSEALKQAADSATSSRTALEAAVDVLQDGFVLFDADDRLVICNQQYRELDSDTAALVRPGVKFEDILRSHVRHGVFPDAIGHEEDWISERLRRRQSGQGEIETQLSDGRWMRAYDKKTPDGGHVGLRIDITKLKLAEAQAEANRTTALDACHDGIAFTDPEGRITYMNRSHIELYGYADHSDVIGRSWKMLYDPRVADWLDQNAIATLRQAGHWAGEVIARHRDGRPIQQDLSLTLNTDGGILCISRDASIRRREEAERDRLREELNISRRREITSQMTAGLAHDFGNLLATIAGGATLIERDAPPGSQIGMNARRLLATAAQTETLIRRLLKLGAGGTEPMLMDLRDPVRDAVELIRAGVSRQASLRAEITETPLELIVDPTDVLQVVLNLAMNASDSLTEPTGEIVVTLREATATDLAGPPVVGQINPALRYYCLSVSDSGRGMAPDIAARAFTPYFSTKGDKGSGLGLAVVASILRANDGAIRLETREGAGSTVSTLWPAQALADLRQHIGEDLAGHLDGRRILVVGNQPDILAMLEQILELAGAEVAPTVDPRLALAVLKDDPGLWDAVITDLAMPRMSGTELAEAIRAIPCDVPVLTIAPTSGAKDARTGLFDATIEKPVKPSLLVRTVSQHIRKQET